MRYECIYVDISHSNFRVLSQWSAAPAAPCVQRARERLRTWGRAGLGQPGISGGARSFRWWWAWALGVFSIVAAHFNIVLPSFRKVFFLQSPFFQGQQSREGWGPQHQSWMWLPSLNKNMFCETTLPKIIAYIHFRWMQDYFLIKFIILYYFFIFNLMHWPNRLSNPS